MNRLHTKSKGVVEIEKMVISIALSINDSNGTRCLRVIKFSGEK